MASITFTYRGKQETGNLQVRLVNTREMIIRVTSEIKSKREFWYNSKGKHKKLYQLSSGGAEAKEHKAFLEKLENAVLKKFMNDFNSGLPITAKWLKETLKEIAPTITNQEEAEEKQKALEKEVRKLQHEKKRIEDLNLVGNALEQIRLNKYANNKSENLKIKRLCELVQDYEQGKEPLKIVDVNQTFCDNFTAWCRGKKYKTSTIIGFLKRIRRAVVYAYDNDEENIIEVSKTLKTFTYPKEKNKKKNKVVVTLDYDELKKIENVELPTSLENARRVILIGCETGLRFSDYNQLKKENLKEDTLFSYWEFYTQKTDSYVRIPKTKRIDYLINRFGFPKTNYSKHSDVKLNIHIKRVCELAGIDEEIKGQRALQIDVDGEIVKRGVEGKYKKFELIGTHTMRRSFATNYYNKLPTDWIRAITGHSSDTQLMDYLNTEKTSDISLIVQAMNKIEESRKENKPILKIVNK